MLVIIKYKYIPIERGVEWSIQKNIDNKRDYLFKKESNIVIESQRKIKLNI